MVNLVRHDLEFILKQIKIAEANSSAHSGEGAKKLTEIRVDADGNVIAEGGTLAVPTTLSPYGLRTVDGSYNNLVDGRNEWGASDTPFGQLTDPYWRDEQDDQIVFGTPQNSVTMNNNNYGNAGSVVDADPRIISNLIVDQSLDNPAAIYAALSYAGVTGQALLTTTQAIRAAKEALDTAIENAENSGGDIPALEQAVEDAQAAADLAQAAADAAQAEADADQAAYEAAVADAQLAETVADQALDDLTAFLIDGIVPDDQQEGYAAALANFLTKQTEFGEAEALATTRGQEAQASAGIAETKAANAAEKAAEVEQAQQALDDALAANGDADAAVDAAQVVLDKLLDDNGVVVDNDSVVLPNVAPDEGLSASYNSWFTLFGQFFDHGLDLVPKGGNGTIYIPLQQDDPLYNPASPHTNFMVLTRAPANPDNLTTPWVDQNQTYSSHASKQLFMREYGVVDGKPLATGLLLEGNKGGLATWADVKAQAREVLGINLTDADVTNIPMFVMDAYGEFVRGPSGFPQMVISLGADNKFGGEGDNADQFLEGNPLSPISTANAVRTGHAFLDDIAHAAGPKTSTGVMLPQDTDEAVGYAGGFDARGNQTSYDNELLDAHYITGDGRGNENIGLTAVHHVFHSEHNHMVDQVKTRAIESGDLDFLNEWLRNPLEAGTALPDPTDAEAVKAFADSLAWDGERLFQAARFTTEMQYQHLVFEEFARKIQPDVDAFVFQPSMDIDPAIFAEFAHVVYRFGHSMLRETVDQTNADGTPNNLDLFEAFLNPLAFGADGLDHMQAAGAIVRGMTSQVGNEIDEFVTGVLRNQLLGIPLDLAALNIARGRETGIPPLNEARRQFKEIASGDTQLDPYTSWTDFMLNLKNPASIVNFIAAYGTHPSIKNATTAEAKRDAAWKIVFGGEGAPEDRLAFLNATGTYAGGKLGGLEDVDLWVGGMAEKKMAFGGMLGSTFSFVFELQLENLQNADRFYYLSRVQGLNFLNELENNSLAKIVLNNTDLGETGYALPGDIFSVPDHVLY
ncbi:MAG: peroxidase family protein, partial [Microvirga sp.]